MATLRTCQIFSDANLTLIAVESLDFQHDKTNTSDRCYGNLKPIAVIVCSPDETYALDMEAKRANLDQMRQDIAELDSLIASFNKT